MSSRRPEDVKMLRLATCILNEDGVEITLGSVIIYSLYRMAN